MTNIDRPADVILGASDLELLHSFKDFPIFMGCSNEPATNDLRADMDFWISRGSGMVQLSPLLPLDILYPEAHGAGSVGRAWANHHESLARFIAKYSPSAVLEIGGAHGILAKNYQTIQAIPWTIVEPNPTPDPGCNATFIKGFFDDCFFFDGEVDAVVHSHVFEHMYNPAAFVKHLARFLPPGKMLIFSIPNMRVMMERKYTNCINFEHTVYLTEDYVDYLLADNGFRVHERNYFQDDHSIFFAAVRDPQVPKPTLEQSLYETNKQAYLDYLNVHRLLIADINSKIKQAKSVYMFGAHAQAQYLIGFGLDISNVSAVLDNDKSKHGKRLYGTDLQVLPPIAVEHLERPIVIVRAGTFTSEIVEQISTINPSTKFLL